MKEVVKDPQKEKNILTTSAQLFAKNGYRETKTDEIANQAGVSKGLLFHYYGNKSGLYEATYEYAADFFYQRIDYSVWTQASDLLEMVVEATKYKIQLQLSYPNEFDFLMKAYTEMPMLPEPLRQRMTEKLNQDFSKNITLTDQVIGKLPLRKEVEEKEVLEIIYAVLNSETTKIQQELTQHPEWQTIEDLMPAIERLKRKLKILEYGFIEKD
ncbi:TetR/AcrR family transcriptional regulator [Enterococcus devriesei]|uniref:TetR/AcrR family transcriptional regulator n=1 Tax=Enterococcus devriesei TaxID=319970 RepID=UPI0028B0311A|nr:TetR/AcrR family transcriptional regulator [Enterococcus devriesei]